MNIYQAFYESLRTEGAATALDMSFRFQNVAYHTCLETLTKLETKGYVRTICRRGSTVFCVVRGVSPESLAAIKETRIVRKNRRRAGVYVTKAVEKAVAYLQTHGESTVAQISRGMNISYSYARSIMRRASAGRLARYRVAAHCTYLWSACECGLREDAEGVDGSELRSCFPGL